MNRSIFKISLTVLALISMGCQKAPEVDGGIFRTEEQTGNTIVNELCSDGTLNCIPEDNPFNTSGTILQQLYEQCVEGCQNEGGLLAACQSQCDDILDTPADTFASDELRIPDNAKAIEVEIEGCVDTQVNNTIKLQGPLMSIVHNRTTESQVMGGGATGIIGVGARGNPIGLNLKCKVEGLYNKVKVTYSPVTGSSVTIKDVPHTVVPFTNGSAISRTYRSPHVAEWGIPSQLREEIDVGQSAWILKKSTGPLNIPVVVQFQYQNNDLGTGLSLVHIFPPLHWAKMKFKLVFFAASK